ncbi:MAG: HEAT repeat domain-containing protein [Planctomycetes bacterium]|nr:HEAT repeat domain-containing protein [Planctomycetota bacterium]
MTSAQGASPTGPGPTPAPAPARVRRPAARSAAPGAQAIISSAQWSALPPRPGVNVARVRRVDASPAAGAAPFYRRLGGTFFPLVALAVAAASTGMAYVQGRPAAEPAGATGPSGPHSRPAQAVHRTGGGSSAGGGAARTAFGRPPAPGEVQVPPVKPAVRDKNAREPLLALRDAQSLEEGLAVVDGLRDAVDAGRLRPEDLSAILRDDEEPGRAYVVLVALDRCKSRLFAWEDLLTLAAGQRAPRMRAVLFQHLPWRGEAPPAAREKLAAALASDPDVDARLAGLETLASISPGPEVVPTCLRLAREDPEFDVRAGAIRVLGGVRPPTDELRLALTAFAEEDQDPRLREAAAAAQARMDAGR